MLTVFVGNIIKDLKSDDDSLHGDAMGRADSFLKKFREDEKKKDKTGACSLNFAYM